MDHHAFQPGDWLVQTKLHPPAIRPETLRRDRLDDALRSAVTGSPLTLVSAPAGSGKTTILASLRLVIPEYPLAWLSLDEEDNDSTRFLAALTTALQRLHPEVGASVWPLLRGVSPDMVGRDRRVMGALINDLLQSIEQPFILVLDDLHVITDSMIYLALEYLLNHLPPQMRIVVGTRHDPPLPLARLAARRQMVELRRSDLAFTPAEARALLNQVLGLSLSDQELTALLTQTEGWAVGLCLLAASLEGKSAPERRSAFLAGISQSERYVFDFLAEEVLRAQAPDVREFLLQTSILAELTPGACRAVTGRADALEVLEGIYRRNLFLVAMQPAEGEAVAYRYHALFARFLQRQLEREFPEQVGQLHRRAAEAQPTPGRAIAHYFAAGLWDQAAQVMEQVGYDLIGRGLSETLCTWYAALPEEVQRAHPRLTLLRGISSIHCGDYLTATLYLDRARSVFAEAGVGPGESAAICGLMTVAVQNGEFDRVRELAERADRLPLNPQGQAMVYMSRAWLSLLDGDWGQVAIQVQGALSVALAERDTLAGISVVAYISPLLVAAPGCLPAVERFCAEMATVAQPGGALWLGLEEIRSYTLLWRGQIEEALRVAEAASERRDRMTGYPVLGSDVTATLATLYAARHRPEEAAQAVHRLLERSEGAPSFQLPFWLHAAGRTLCLVGRLAEAHQLNDRLQAITSTSPFTPVLQAHLAGLLALVERRTAQAEEFLQRAAELERSVPVTAAAGSARLLLARLRLDQGRQTEALALLAEALAADELHGRIVLVGDLVAPVLRLAAGQGDLRAARLLELVGAPPVAPAALAAAAASAVEQLLTPREIDVLRLLTAGATNREIGEQLFVSEQTVKTHVVHILRKLDVTSRTQAAIRGRELGL